MDTTLQAQIEITKDIVNKVTQLELNNVKDTNKAKNKNGRRDIEDYSWKKI